MKHSVVGAAVRLYCPKIFVIQSSALGLDLAFLGTRPAFDACLSLGSADAFVGRVVADPGAITGGAGATNGSAPGEAALSFE